MGTLRGSSSNASVRIGRVGAIVATLVVLLHLAIASTQPSRIVSLPLQKKPRKNSDPSDVLPFPLGSAPLWGSEWTDYVATVTIDGEDFDCVIDTGSSSVAVAISPEAQCSRFYTQACTGPITRMSYGSGNWTGRVCTPHEGLHIGGLSAGRIKFGGIERQHHMLQCSKDLPPGVYPAVVEKDGTITHPQLGPLFQDLYVRRESNSNPTDVATANRNLATANSVPSDPTEPDVMTTEIRRIVSLRQRTQSGIAGLAYSSLLNSAGSRRNSSTTLDSLLGGLVQQNPGMKRIFAIQSCKWDPNHAQDSIQRHAMHPYTTSDSNTTRHGSSPNALKLWTHIRQKLVESQRAKMAKSGGTAAAAAATTTTTTTSNTIRGDGQMHGKKSYARAKAGLGHGALDLGGVVRTRYTPDSELQWSPVLRRLYYEIALLDLELHFPKQNATVSLMKLLLRQHERRLRRMKTNAVGENEASQAVGTRSVPTFTHLEPGQMLESQQDPQFNSRNLLETLDELINRSPLYRELVAFGYGGSIPPSSPAYLEDEAEQTKTEEASTSRRRKAKKNHRVNPSLTRTDPSLLRLLTRLPAQLRLDPGAHSSQEGNHTQAAMDVDLVEPIVPHSVVPIHDHEGEVPLSPIHANVTNTSQPNRPRTAVNHGEAEEEGSRFVEVVNAYFDRLAHERASDTLLHILKARTKKPDKKMETDDPSVDNDADDKGTGEGEEQAEDHSAEKQSETTADEAEQPSEKAQNSVARPPMAKDWSAAWRHPEGWDFTNQDLSQRAGKPKKKKLQAKKQATAQPPQEFVADRKAAEQRMLPHSARLVPLPPADKASSVRVENQDTTAPRPLRRRYEKPPPIWFGKWADLMPSPEPNATSADKRRQFVRTIRTWDDYTEALDEISRLERLRILQKHQQERIPTRAEAEMRKRVQASKADFPSSESRESPSSSVDSAKFDEGSNQQRFVSLREEVLRRDAKLIQKLEEHMQLLDRLNDALNSTTTSLLETESLVHLAGSALNLAERSTVEKWNKKVDKDQASRKRRHGAWAMPAIVDSGTGPLALVPELFALAVLTITQVVGVALPLEFWTGQECSPIDLIAPQAKDAWPTFRLTVLAESPSASSQTNQRPDGLPSFVLEVRPEEWMPATPPLQCPSFLNPEPLFGREHQGIPETAAKLATKYAPNPEQAEPSNPSAGSTASTIAAFRQMLSSVDTEAKFPPPVVTQHSSRSQIALYTAAHGGNFCLLTPFPSVNIFGQAVMQRYYTVFDLEKDRVGFAPVDGCSEEARHRDRALWQKSQQASAAATGVPNLVQEGELGSQGGIHDRTSNEIIMVQRSEMRPHHDSESSSTTATSSEVASKSASKEAASPSSSINHDQKVAAAGPERMKGRVHSSFLFLGAVLVALLMLGGLPAYTLFLRIKGRYAGYEEVPLNYRGA